eukprot:g4082.t1
MMMMMMMISGSRYLRSFVVRSSHQQHRLLTCFGERDVRNSGKRRSVRWKSTLDSDNECVGVNLSTYPIHRPGSKEYDDLIEKSREDLRKTGCATFENFWNDEVVERATNHVAEHASTAFETDNEHNAYQLSGHDENYADTHPRNVFMRTRVASLAYDELEIGRSPLYDLYNSKHFVDFVRDVTSQNKMYRLADKLGACSVNIFRPGWFHEWHFDESEFTTTLCLQQAEEGGEFEFTPRLRDSQKDLCAPEVARIIRENSTHTHMNAHGDEDIVAPAIHNAKFDPGTLQIFAGRYSLHRVKPIPQHCNLDRYVAVFCFASNEGVVNSPDVQKMFWGRTA